MNEFSFQCEHFPKRFRLTLDVGNNDSVYLELCSDCRNQQEKKFLQREEVLKN